jgi:hypothetical protein
MPRNRHIVLCTVYAELCYSNYETRVFFNNQLKLYGTALFIFKTERDRLTRLNFPENVINGQRLLRT